MSLGIWSTCAFSDHQSLWLLRTVPTTENLQLYTALGVRFSLTDSRFLYLSRRQRRHPHQRQRLKHNPTAIIARACQPWSCGLSIGTFAPQNCTGSYWCAAHTNCLWANVQISLPLCGLVREVTHLGQLHPRAWTLQFSSFSMDHSQRC